ncbi:MAG: hypothetical protein M3460_29665 [Actinomycetota bacterium]|nr:hypothetical protein [Actinomycetota bacterium]
MDGSSYRREGQAVGLDVIGEVFAEAMRTLLDLSSWLGSQSRTQRLINTILNITQGVGHAEGTGYRRA